MIPTRTNGIEALLEDGKACFPVERTEEAVADAMIRLAGDPELRARMGSTGVERILRDGPERFTNSVLKA